MKEGDLNRNRCKQDEGQRHEPPEEQKGTADHLYKLKDGKKVTGRSQCAHQGSALLGQLGHGHELQKPVEPEDEEDEAEDDARDEGQT